MLVDVQTDDGVYLAKITCETDTSYVLRYLVYKKKGVYVYDKDIEVDKECICGVYDPDDTEEAAGFTAVEGGFVVKDEDDEYEPSDTSESDTDESLVDEDDDEA